MPQEFLHSANVVTGVEHVRREAMSQGVRTDRLGDTGAPTRLADGALRQLLGSP